MLGRPRAHRRLVREERRRLLRLQRGERARLPFGLRMLGRARPQAAGPVLRRAVALARLAVAAGLGSRARRGGGFSRPTPRQEVIRRHRAAEPLRRNLPIGERLRVELAHPRAVRLVRARPLLRPCRLAAVVRDRHTWGWGSGLGLGAELTSPAGCAVRGAGVFQAEAMSGRRRRTELELQSGELQESQR